ncbi:unnamed protein product [Kuraishia capsulata CBS 1993]|uniref:Uncharacterized protein n=1 Tax=Kuraishia capsulata CBS 1993 TaxID=1382522 RepID=W6MN30_9ASCO|nr:uncharacterized protein KUCA_T00003999001 [Kuraishia capsulata CBS 1993]CDK28019.1 unnamed protein product [Kuraishia capsulata CBS 1993]
MVLKVGNVGYYKKEYDEQEHKDSISWDIDIIVLTEQDLKIIKLDKDVETLVKLSSHSEGSASSHITNPDIADNPEVVQYSLGEVPAKS